MLDVVFGSWMRLLILKKVFGNESGNTGCIRKPC